MRKQGVVFCHRFAHNPVGLGLRVDSFEKRLAVLQLYQRKLFGAPFLRIVRKDAGRLHLSVAADGCNEEVRAFLIEQCSVGGHEIAEVLVAEGPYGYCRAIALLYLGESRLHLHGSGCHRRKQQPYYKSFSHYS